MFCHRDCSECGFPQPTLRKPILLNTPKVLQIQLERFKYKGVGQRFLSDKEISPVIIDRSVYMESLVYHSKKQSLIY